MPYRSRRSYGKRRSYSRSRGRYARSAAYTGRVPRGEVKFLDTKLSLTNVLSKTDSTGLLVNPSATVMVNAVAQGAGDQQRLGRQNRQWRLDITGVIDCVGKEGSTSIYAPPEIAIWVVLDKNANGAVPLTNAVVTNLSQSKLLCPLALPNLLYKSRFLILKKLLFRMPQPTVTDDGAGTDIAASHKRWACSVNLRGMLVGSTGTDASIADMPSNAIHIMAGASEADVSIPQIAYNARLHFTG